MTFEWSNAKDWAKVYKGVSVMYEGIAEYPNERVFLSKDTLKKCVPGLKGRPVIIQHQAGITPENMKEHEVGYVTNCYYNNETGDFDCDFVIDDDTAKDLLDNKGYTLSTSYIAKSFGNSGTFINSKYDREITDLDFRHLAIVKNPRYERVKVYQNEVEEIENGGPGSGDFDHAGRPGLVGGSEPSGTGRNGKYEDGKKHWIGAKPRQQKLDFDGKKEEKKKEEKKTQESTKETSKEKQDELKQKARSFGDYIYAVNSNTFEKLDKLRAKIPKEAEYEAEDKLEYIKDSFKKYSKYMDSTHKQLTENVIAKLKRYKTSGINDNEKQNDTEKEYNMDKIEVEQGFLNSLIGLVAKQFDNAKKEEKEEDKDLEEVLEDEKEVEGEKEKEKENKEEEKPEEKENKCKNNSVEVDYYELMKEKFNSVEAGADDKIKVVTRETAFENGRKIYG